MSGNTTEHILTLKRYFSACWVIKIGNRSLIAYFQVKPMSQKNFFLKKTANKISGVNFCKEDLRLVSLWIYYNNENDKSLKDNSKS